MSAAVSTTTGTALYGVTGWPLSQSLSPLLHNTGFAALGINALYMKWEVPPQKLPAFVESVRLLNIRGCSVTIPHKVELLPLLDEVSPLASRVGAANTIYWKGERLCGENTMWLALWPRLPTCPSLAQMCCCWALAALRGPLPLAL